MATPVPEHKPKFPGENILRMRPNPMPFLMKLAKDYGEIVTFKLGRQQIYLINNPDYIKQVLVTQNQNFVRGRGGQQLKRLLGEGLLTSEGEYHTQQRKLMAPAFTPRRLEHYAEAMVACTDRAQRGWDDGAILNLDSEMMNLTISIVSKVLLNTEFNDSGETKELAAAINTGQQWIKYASSGILPLPLSVPTPRNLNTRKAIALVKNRVETPE